MIVLPIHVINDPLFHGFILIYIFMIHGLLYMCLYSILSFPKRDCAFLNISWAKRLLPFYLFVFYRITSITDAVVT